MWAHNALIAAIVVQLLWVFPASADETVRVPVALEGFVRDDSGKAVQGVLVSVSEGSYTTQGHTDVVPLILPGTVEAVVFDDPNVTNIHYYNTHYTKTDGNGHYTFRQLAPGQYTFKVRGMRKDSKYYFTTNEGSLTENKKLLAKYSFPPAEQIVIKGGQSTVKDVVLRPSKLAATCSVPKPAQPEDAKFIDALAAKAVHGNPQAILMMGYAYQHGQHGVAPDPVQAACWFRTLAAKTSPATNSTYKARDEALRALRQLHETIY